MATGSPGEPLSEQVIRVVGVNGCILVPVEEDQRDGGANAHLPRLPSLSHGQR